MDVLKILLLALSANLDVFVLAFSYGVKKCYLPISSVIIISALTLLGTFLSMMFGKTLSNFFPTYIGSIFFILIGFYGMFKTLLSKEEVSIVKVNMVNSLILGFFLAINNTFLGLSSSLMEFNVFITSISSFALCFILIILGNLIGVVCTRDNIQKKASILSNLIIIVLGFVGIFA